MHAAMRAAMRAARDRAALADARTAAR